MAMRRGEDLGDESPGKEGSPGGGPGSEGTGHPRALGGGGGGARGLGKIREEGGGSGVPGEGEEAHSPRGRGLGVEGPGRVATRRSTRARQTYVCVFARARARARTTATSCGETKLAQANPSNRRLLLEGKVRLPPPRRTSPSQDSGHCRFFAGELLFDLPRFGSFFVGAPLFEVPRLGGFVLGVLLFGLPSFAACCAG